MYCGLGCGNKAEYESYNKTWKEQVFYCERCVDILCRNIGLFEFNIERFNNEFNSLIEDLEEEILEDKENQKLLDLDKKKYYVMKTKSEEEYEKLDANSAFVQLTYRRNDINYFRVISVDACKSVGVWTTDLTIEQAVIEKFCAENRIYFEEFGREERIFEFVNSNKYVEELKKAQKITAKFIN